MILGEILADFPKSKEVAFDAVLELLTQPLDIYLISANQTSYPHDVPLWFYYENGTMYLAVDTSSKTARLLKENPRVAGQISGHLPTHPDQMVSLIIEAEVILEIDEAGFWKERISHKYLPETAAKTRADRGRVVPKTLIKIPINQSTTKAVAFPK